jgi:hypothetical protein
LYTLGKIQHDWISLQLDRRSHGGICLGTLSESPYPAFFSRLKVTGEVARKRFTGKC